MAVRVAINGFGRIGRLAFRQMFGAEGYEVVAINDLTSPKMLAHLLKYDSSQGSYEKKDTVTAGEDSITVDGKTIKIYKEADANNLPWGELKVDVVLECTGFYVSKEKSQAHINAGAAISDFGQFNIVSAGPASVINYILYILSVFLQQFVNLFCFGRIVLILIKRIVVIRIILKNFHTVHHAFLFPVTDILSEHCPRLRIFFYPGPRRKAPV